MLRSYQRRWLRNDLLAGATVFVVLVPSALAYGGLAGLQPVAGLYAALAAMAAYALFGSSRHLIIGPDAALPLILAVTVGPLAGGDVERYAVLTAGLSLLVGIICITARWIRAGFLVNFLAQPILTGYLAGVALLVIVSQLGRILGIQLASDTVVAQLWEVVQRFTETHRLTLVIGVGSLVTLVIMQRVVPRVPAPLLVMIATTVATRILDWDTHGLAVIGSIPAGLPRIILPWLSRAELQSLILPAVTIALISFADEIITARSFAAKYHYEIDANQELVALGMADIASGLVGGFPVSSSSARTAVVTVMGGRTQVASLVAVGLLALFLVLFTSLLAFLPLVVLATVLIVAVAGLIDLHAFRQLYTIRPSEFWLAIVTMVAVLTLGLLAAILLSVTLALGMALKRIVQPHDAVLLARAGMEGYREIAPDTAGEHAMLPGLIVYRFDGPLMFANAPLFREQTRAVIRSSLSPVRWLLVDAEAIVDIDTTAASMLIELTTELQAQGIGLAFARTSESLYRMFQKTGVVSHVGAPHFFPLLSSAVRALDEGTGAGDTHDPATSTH